MKYRKRKGKDFCRGEHKIYEVRKICGVLKDLKGFARRLSKFDIHSCNVGLTIAQEKKVERIEDACSELAKKIGLKAYHQCDPRGCSLYLIDETMDDTNYSRGIAIY